MKHKEETKITTLCRLVAAYNSTLYSPKDCPAARVDVIITHNNRVRLVLVLGNNTTSIYDGDLDSGISYMAKRLCGRGANVCIAIEY